MDSSLRRCVAACGLIVTLTTVSWGDLRAQSRPPREDPNSDSSLYRVYCASCHGTNGAGDGPAAPLLRRPLPDLRTIATRDGGTFPAERVARIIDGRNPLPGHMRGEMPVWGSVLRTMELEDEGAVAVRIAQLVAHLQSMQAKHP